MRDRIRSAGSNRCVSRRSSKTRFFLNSLPNMHPRTFSPPSALTSRSATPATWHSWSSIEAKMYSQWCRAISRIWRKWCDYIPNGRMSSCRKWKAWAMQTSRSWRLTLPTCSRPSKRISRTRQRFWRTSWTISTTSRRSSRSRWRLSRVFGRRISSHSRSRCSNRHPRLSSLSLKEATTMRSRIWRELKN